MPGLVEIASILVRLAERKQKVHIGLHCRSARRDLTLHSCDGRILEAIGFQVREAPVCLPQIGAQANACVIGCDSVVIAPHCLQNVAQPHQRADVVRAKLDAALVSLDGFIRERCRRERRAAQVVRLRVGSVQCNYTVEALQRFGIAVLLLAQAAEVQKRRHKVRDQRQRLLQQAFRQVVIPRVQGDRREQPHGVDVARVVT
jgi:hypothetical protein